MTKKRQAQEPEEPSSSQTAGILRGARVPDAFVKFFRPAPGYHLRAGRVQDRVHLFLAYGAEDEIGVVREGEVKTHMELVLTLANMALADMARRRRPLIRKGRGNRK
jgi:hypothetical protein